MSYELKIDPKSRAAGRFVGMVRKALVSAAIEEKRASKVTQSAVARKLDVDRSFISRLLKGEANLTLRTVGELAWALGWEPVFSLRRKGALPGSNIGPAALAESSSNNPITVMIDDQLSKPMTSSRVSGSVQLDLVD